MIHRGELSPRPLASETVLSTFHCYLDPQSDEFTSFFLPLGPRTVFAANYKAVQNIYIKGQGDHPAPKNPDCINYICHC